MKKINFLCNSVIAAAMAVALTGCNKDVPPVGPTEQEGDSITATIEGYQQTRTFLEWGEDNQGSPIPLVKWSNGDQIALCADQDDSGIAAPTCSRYTYVQGEGNPTSLGEYKFNLDANEKVVVGTNYAAFYPASMLNSMSSQDEYFKMQAGFTLPAVQHYTANSFDTNSLPMVSWGTDKGRLYFSHTCGLLELKVFGSDDVSIQSIEFAVSANSPTKYPAGDMSMNVIIMNDYPLIYVAPAPSLAAADGSSVRLDCGQGVALAGTETATNFYIVLPYNLYTDFTLTLTANNGQTMTKTFTASESNPGLYIDRAKITTSSLTFKAEPAMQLGYRDDDQNFVEFDKDQNGDYIFTTYLGDAKALVAMANGQEVNPTWEKAFNEDEEEGNLQLMESKGKMILYVLAYNTTAPYRVGEIRATYNNATTSATIGSQFEGLCFMVKDTPFKTFYNNLLTAEEFENNSQTNPWIVGLNTVGWYPAICQFYGIKCMVNSGYDVIPAYRTSLEGIDQTNGNDITVTYYQPENMFMSNYAVARSASNVAQRYYVHLGQGFMPVWIKVVDDTTVKLGNTDYYGYPGITASSEEYFKPEFSNQMAQTITWTSSDSTAVEFWDGGSMLGLRNGKARVGGVIPDNADLAKFSRNATVTATLANGNTATATVHNNIDRIYLFEKNFDWGTTDSFNAQYQAISKRARETCAKFYQDTFSSNGYFPIPWYYVEVISSNEDVLYTSISDDGSSLVLDLNSRSGQSTLTYKVGSDACGYVKFDYVVNIADFSKSSNGNVEHLTYGNQFNF